MVWSERKFFGPDETPLEIESEILAQDFLTMVKATRPEIKIIPAKPGTHQPIIMGQPMQDKKKRGKT